MNREEAIKWFEGEKEAAERQVVAFESCFKCFKSAHRKIVAYNDMAISALREQPRWISVEERLPEEWRDESEELINYMVFMPEYGVDIGNYLKPAKTWVCMGIPCKVTHWMPLPEGPEVEV